MQQYNKTMQKIINFDDVIKKKHKKIQFKLGTGS